MSSELAARFHRLFAGLERAHGTYSDISETREDGKLTGTAVTLRQPVTDDLWDRHLNGTHGIGIIPIRPDSTVYFGALDIDAYTDFDPASVAAQVARLKLPLIVCRSKSGGAHVYCFTREPVPAASMQAKLKEAAALLGRGGCEVFPKQSKLLSAEGDLGSWINMPYFGAASTTRYALGPEGDHHSAEAFLDAAEAAKVDPEFFGSSLGAGKGPEEFKDGPPCLSTLVQIGFPEGQRNDGLYNICIFVKRRFPDEWERRLHDYNERFMKPPLSSSEVQTVIGSFRKDKDYRYKCSQPPIAPHCNSGLCRTRKYGVGGGRMPEFGPMAQQEGDTVLWFWSVDGKRIRLTTDELFRFHKFRERCAEALRVVVPGMKQKDWDDVIQRAMETCEVIPGTEDTTQAGALWEQVVRYCTHITVHNMDDVRNGGLKPYAGEDGRTYFRLAGLADYLKRQQFRAERGEIGRVLKQHGGEHHADNVCNGKSRTTCNYWSVPSPSQSKSLDLAPTEEGPGF